VILDEAEELSDTRELTAKYWSWLAGRVSNISSPDVPWL